MKYKTTIKNIMRNYNNIRHDGRHDIHDLLINHEPFAYTSGIYGWNFDVYDVYGVTICTGDRNTPGEPLEYIDEYNKKAAAILHYTNTQPYNEKAEAVENLLKEFCLKNGGKI